MTESRQTILFVEDDADIRDTLADVLEEDGFAVKSAAHGQEALELLRGGLRPSLILLDLMMPIMNGWQFRAQQLKEPDLSGIPVVVVSAGANIEQSAAGLSAAGFVKKPVVLDNLLNAVRSALG
jgi:CheY-like chemotaxis protein